MSLHDLFLRLDRAGSGDAESLRWALIEAFRREIATKRCYGDSDDDCLMVVEPA